MSKKAKLPKRIAGYKIPRSLRKNSKPLLKLLATPQAQALIATAFAAGAAALAEQNHFLMEKKWTAKKAKRRLKFLAAEGQDRASEMAASVGRAVAGAISAFLPLRETSIQHSKATH